MTHEEMLEEAQNREAINIAKQAIAEYQPALQELAKTEVPYYRFFACDYFATGEGRCIWLFVDLFSKDQWHSTIEDFREFVGCEYYWGLIEEYTEEQFFGMYGSLIPDSVKCMLEYRDQPAFTWKTQLYYNYS